MPITNSVLALAVATSQFAGIPKDLAPPLAQPQATAMPNSPDIPDDLETRDHAHQWIHYAIDKSRTTGAAPKSPLNHEQAGIIDQELDNIRAGMAAAPQMADCTGIAFAIRDTTKFSNNVTYALAHLSLRPVFDRMQMVAHFVHAESREDKILPELADVFRAAKRRMIKNENLVGWVYRPIDEENCTMHRPIEGVPDMAGMK